jgi:hypothetical protein
MLNFEQIAANVAQPCDGAVGFYDGTNNFIAWGWTAASNTLDKLWRSTDGGVTFAALPDLPFPAHTLATAMKGNVLYAVGGDVFNPINSGDFIRSSGKIESGVYSEIAADCGIEDRCLCQLVYNPDADEFLLLGGQQGTNISDGIYNTVMRSVDNCASFSTILADTTPFFAGGLLWGSVAYFKGLYWKVGGAMYDNIVSKRTYVRSIFSSPDGIDWTYQGEFKGHGRHYMQLIEYNNKLRVIDGYNPFYGDNLADIWTLDWNGIRVLQTYEGSTPFTPRHAQSCWKNDAGILLFAGTDNDAPTVNNDLWLITE